MDITTSFMPLLQVFTAVMTEPTSESFRQLVTGWIFASFSTGGLRPVAEELTEPLEILLALAA